MTTKERFLRLADELSEPQMDDILRYAARQREDPMLSAIANAPEDDEPLTPEEEAAIDEGRADIAAGRTVSLEDVERQYGYL